MQRGICLAAVLAPGDGARVLQLLAWGDCPWERRGLGVWDLGEVRAGCAPVLDADQHPWPLSD